MHRKLFQTQPQLDLIFDHLSTFYYLSLTRKVDSFFNQCVDQRKVVEFPIVKKVIGATCKLFNPPHSGLNRTDPRKKKK